MRSEVYSLAYVDGMIDYVENKIETKALSSGILATMQKWLDTVEEMYRDDPELPEYYSRMLELQALIYGESNQDAKAMQFMKEAVRQAGSVGALYSRLIKEYIAEKAARPAPKPAPAPVAEEVYADQIAAEEPGLAYAEPAAADYYDEDYGDDRIELHDKPRHRFRKLKIAFAVVFGLVALSAATFHFVPQASAVSMLLVRHGEIQRAKEHFDSLTSQYKTCSAKLADEHNSVDTADSAAVQAYNQEMQDCQSIMQQQNKAADAYNTLIGKPGNGPQ